MVSLIWSLLEFIVAFAFVIGLLFITLQVLRRQFQPSGGGRYLEVLDALPLGRDKSVHLVRLGETVYLLGVTAHRVDTLATLPAGELGEPRTAATEGFAATLDKVLGSGFGARFNREEIENRLDHLRNAIKHFRQGRGGGGA